MTVNTKPYLVYFQNVIKELIERNSSEPDNVDDGFVVSHNTSDGSINILVSSLRLLKNSVNAETISTDATYQLLGNGFLVTTFGKIREDGKMDLIAIGVSSNANPRFEYMFKEVKEAAMKYYDYLMCPDFLICASENDIQNAFLTVFGHNVTILLCPAYMERIVKRKIQRLIPKQQHQQILDDLNVLKLLQDIEIFEKTSLLFMKKYEHFKDFIAFFDSEWLRFNRNWMVLRASNKITAISGHEYIYRLLKDTKNVNGRVPLDMFIEVIKELSEKQRLLDA